VVELRDIVGVDGDRFDVAGDAVGHLGPMTALRAGIFSLSTHGWITGSVLSQCVHPSEERVFGPQAAGRGAAFRGAVAGVSARSAFRFSVVEGGQVLAALKAFVGDGVVTHMRPVYGDR
jgi:hypothetical protein